MHIHRRGSRLHRAEPVMIILRMKVAHMADRLRLGGVKPVLAPAHRILIGHRPTVRARHNAHPVRPQHMQLQRQTALAAHRFQITVTRQQQLRIKRLQQLCTPLRTIGPCDQLQHRMSIKPLARILANQRQGRRRLRNQLDRAKPDRVPRKPRPRQRHRIARVPRHPTRGLHPHHTSRCRCLGFHHLHRAALQKIKHLCISYPKSLGHPAAWAPLKHNLSPKV